MSRGFANRHYYVKTVNDNKEYYAKYNGQSIRIDKELYDFLKRSYSKERELERTERRHVAISIDQMHENISQCDRHGTVLSAFQVGSPENEFFDLDSPDKQEKLIELMKRNIASLPTEEQELIHSFGQESSAIEKLAEESGLTVRAMKYRRRKIADRVANSIIEDFFNEASGL